MDTEAILGPKGSLRRNVTVSLIVALIIAALFGLLRNYGQHVRRIPGAGPVLDFLAPNLQAPDFSVGEFERRPPPVFNIPPNTPPEFNFNSGSNSACCNSCAGSPRGSLISDISEWLANATRNAAPPTLPPPAQPCFPRTDWRAFAQHPANRDLMQAYERLTAQDWQWVASYGFPSTLSGYAQYMAEFDPVFSRSVREGRRPQPRGFTTC
jgi:hypothetical protein